MTGMTTIHTLGGPHSSAPVEALGRTPLTCLASYIAVSAREMSSSTFTGRRRAQGWLAVG